EKVSNSHRFWADIFKLSQSNKLEAINDIPADIRLLFDLFLCPYRLSFCLVERLLGASQRDGAENALSILRHKHFRACSYPSTCFGQIEQGIKSSRKTLGQFFPQRMEAKTFWQFCSFT